MKAITTSSLGGGEKLRLVDQPIPEPKENQVRIRVKSAGVGLWDETYIRGEIPSVLPKFPLTPGWEGAGVISAIGSDVTRFKLGDEVVFIEYPEDDFSGAWAEEVLVPERCVGRKPKSISMEQAGGLPVMALTPYQVLHDEFAIRPGQTLLICNGAGGVGTCAIQLARLMGAKTIALASESNHALLKSLGADFVFDYHKDFTSEVCKLFAEGIDCVFDDIGDRETVAKSIPCLKSGGKFITIVNRFEDLERKDVQNSFFAAQPDGERLEEIGRIVDEGKLRVVIDQVYPLEDFRAAIEQVGRRHVHGKVVLKIA